jgi:hypothetical protein
MKTTTVLFMTGLIASSLLSCAQDKQSRPSPAAKATGKAGKATITIDYSSPAVKGRKVYGDLVPFGKIWRAGANEATIFEVDNDVKIEGQALAKGKYGLFTIPGESEWTIVFNKTWNQWGSYRYKQEEDVLRVKVASQKTAKMVENLTYSVENGKVYLRWENTEVAFRVD